VLTFAQVIFCLMKKLKTNELNRLSTSQFKEAEKNPVVVVLDNIRSLNNVGSVFRTADAFRLERIYLCGITAQPPHRDIHKTALGATDAVDWKYQKNGKEAITALKSLGYKILVLEQTDQSIPLTSFQPSAKDKYALIFGNEVKGVDNELLRMADTCIEIPQFGTKHSFNVTVSAGIVIWDLLVKMKRV
jgi:tRNA G18 (ribose-2'-O)-methylase SpoU